MGLRTVSTTSSPSHQPEERLDVLLSRAAAADGSLVVVDVAQHVELRTLAVERQCAVVRSLVASRAVQDLNVSHNLLGDEAAAELATAVARHSASAKPGLRRLVAEGNCIGEAGGLALARALRTNRRLTVLSVAAQMRPLPPSAVRAFLAVLQGDDGTEANMTLVKLNLGDYRDERNALRTSLARLLSRNTEHARQERWRTRAPSGLAPGRQRRRSLDSDTADAPSPRPLSKRLLPAARQIEPVVAALTTAHVPVDWAAEAVRIASSLPPGARRLCPKESATAGRPAFVVNNDAAFAAAPEEERRACIAAFASNTAYVEAHMANVGLTDADCEAWAAVLSRNSTLEVLSLDGNAMAMGPGAVEALAGAIRSNTALTDLAVSAQLVPWTQGAMAVLANAVADNSSLRRFVLGGEGPGHAAARAQIDLALSRNRRAPGRRATGSTASTAPPAADERRAPMRAGGRRRGSPLRRFPPRRRAGPHGGSSNGSAGPDPAHAAHATL